MRGPRARRVGGASRRPAERAAAAAQCAPVGLPSGLVPGLLPQQLLCQDVVGLCAAVVPGDHLAGAGLGLGVLARAPQAARELLQALAAPLVQAVVQLQRARVHLCCLRPGPPRHGLLALLLGLGHHLAQLVPSLAVRVLGVHLEASLVVRARCSKGGGKSGRARVARVSARRKKGEWEEGRDKSEA